MNNHHEPILFERHSRQLHALLLETQAWFSARDLGRLIGCGFDKRLTRKLDADQYREVWLLDHGQWVETLMISESAVYTLLVHYHHPENRNLRQWLTNQVVPALRGLEGTTWGDQPAVSVMQWPGLSLSVLHWHSEPWIMLRDLPKMLTEEQQRLAWPRRPLGARMREVASRWFSA